MAKDLERLQGSWTITALDMEGQPMPAAMLENARVVIRGNRFTGTGMGAVYEGTLKLNFSAKPAQLDFTFSSGPEKGNTNYGIYQLKGDTLKLCIATRGDSRPTKFDSMPGSGWALETLTRESVRDTAQPKPQSARKQTAKTAMKKAEALVMTSAGVVPHASPKSGERVGHLELEGEWLMLSGIIDGKPMDKSMVKWVRRVTEGSRTTVLAGRNVMMQADFTSDASQTPKTIDYRTTAGSHKGKTQLGIYEFANGVLKIYMAPPGAERPRKIETAPKKGTLTVWKRA